MFVLISFFFLLTEKTEEMEQIEVNFLFLGLFHKIIEDFFHLNNILWTIKHNAFINFGNKRGCKLVAREKNSWNHWIIKEDKRLRERSIWNEILFFCQTSNGRKKAAILLTLVVCFSLLLFLDTRKWQWMLGGINLSLQ